MLSEYNVFKKNIRTGYSETQGAHYIANKVAIQTLNVKFDQISKAIHQTQLNADQAKGSQTRNKSNRRDEPLENNTKKRPLQQNRSKHSTSCRRETQRLYEKQTRDIRPCSQPHQEVQL